MCLFGYDALTFQVVDHVDQRLPKSVHIEQNERFSVHAEDIGGCSGENFVERTNAAGQGDEGFTLAQHDGFAVVEVCTAELYVNCLAD